MAYPSTFSDIQGRVTRKARMDTNNTTDVQDIKDWINIAYAQACAEVKFYLNDGSATSTLSANASSVSFPTSLVELDRISLSYQSQNYRPLQEVSLDEILRLRMGNSTAGGPPSRYAVVYQTIELWPNAQGGEILTFWGAQLPTALAANSDVPIIPEPYGSKLLEYGALVEAADFKSDPSVDYYRQIYEDWLRRFRAFKNKRSGVGVKRLDIVGFPVRPPHDPSTDIGA